jgi:serine/threonine-protein kinase
MRNDLPLRTAARAERWLLVTLFAVAIYILSTIARIPPIAASHFTGSGAPNGVMSKSRYLAFLLIFAIGLPALIGFVPARGLSGSTPRVNLPNRDYWFAPERRGLAVAMLKAYFAQVGAGVALFMAFIHWLIFRANALRPPHLEASALLVGTAVFVTAMLLRSIALVITFRGGAER